MRTAFVVRECVDCGASFECRIIAATSIATRCGACSRLIGGNPVHADLVATAKALREILLVRA
jgi:hypothetical protein